VTIRSKWQTSRPWSPPPRCASGCTPTGSPEIYGTVVAVSIGLIWDGGPPIVVQGFGRASSTHTVFRCGPAFPGARLFSLSIIVSEPLFVITASVPRLRGQREGREACSHRVRRARVRVHYRDYRTDPERARFDEIQTGRLLRREATRSTVRRPQQDIRIRTGSHSP
jgi:hypothetical protein